MASGALDQAERLVAARKAAGFRYANEAAARFGWSRATYAQHENGLRGYRKAAATYAKAFRVSEAWLLTGEGRGPSGTPMASQTSEKIDRLTEIFEAASPEFQEELLRHAETIALASRAAPPSPGGDPDPDPKAR